MKKLILFGMALLLSFGFANAQLQSKGAHDDFASATEYSGITWSVNGGSTSQLSLTRAAGSMTIASTSGSNLYPFFEVDFGTTVDLKTNLAANITVTVQNTSSQLLFMDIKLLDTNNVQSEFEPNISDLAGTTWSDPQRIALNGFTLAGGQTKTITIDLSSVAANIGGLSGYDAGGAAGFYDCTGPSDCPQTAHLIDASVIKAVLFRVNFGNNNIDLSEGDGNYATETFISGASITRFVGSFKFTDFKIGTVTAATAVKNSMIDKTLSVYPTPASDVLNVSFDAAEGGNVSLSDVFGNTVLTASANAGVNKLVMNTAGLSTGIYLLNIVTEGGTVARKVIIN